MAAGRLCHNGSMTFAEGFNPRETQNKEKEWRWMGQKDVKI